MAPNPRPSKLPQPALVDPPQDPFDDPLAAILGPGSNARLLGAPDDDIPPEIVNMFSEHQLSKKKFRVILKHVPEGASETSSNLPYVKSWVRSIPSIDYIGREYGPGNYLLRFMWESKDNPSGNPRSCNEDLAITVSDKYLAEYKKHQFESKLKEIEDRRRKVQDMKIEGALEANMDPLLESAGMRKPEIPIEEAAVKYIENVSTMAQRLGFNTARGGIDWEKILPIAMTAIPAVLKLMTDSRMAAAAENQKFIAMMMGMMSQNSNQLLEVVRGQQNPRGADLTKEMFDMIKGAIDVKEMISGSGKESVADRVFSIIAQVAPNILEIAKLNAMQRQMDPRYQMAKLYAQSNPDINAAAHNPSIAADLYKKLDATFGWRQADMIMGEVGGVPRPDSCPRNPAQENPAPQPSTDSPPEAVDAEVEFEEDRSPLGGAGEQ